MIWAMDVGVPGTERSLHDRRIERITPLAPPAVLMEEHPLTDAERRARRRHREEVTAVLDRADPRLMVVVGPC